MVINESPTASEAATAIRQFLESLKGRTTIEHQNLESQILLEGLMSEQVTVGRYHNYLALMKEVSRVYEQTILPVVDLGLSRRDHVMASELIGQDLAELGYTPSHNCLPLPYDLAITPVELPLALGFMYVMEGSKLGGKVIYRHINKTLQFSSANGARYLADNGCDTGRNWKEFLAIFAKFIVENKMEEQVIQGARFAFVSIYAYFESNRTVYGV